MILGILAAPGSDKPPKVFLTNPVHKDMKQSLRYFMNEIIDYAGLFPPAGLSLDTSLHKYSDYRKNDNSWMLSRFIIPGDRLDELIPYQDSMFSADDPFKLSILGKSTATLDEYEERLQELISQVNRFHNKLGSRVLSEILEIKIPREALFSNDYSLLGEVFNKTAQALTESEHTPQYVFYEAVFEENWKKDIHHVMDSLSGHNRIKYNGNYRYAGFKLRCGGTEAEMVPSIEQVASTLIDARDQNVALKCTAGLHHPVRHFSDSVQTDMHGFFNVFGGAMLSYAHDLNIDELGVILRDKDPDHFTFTEEAFQWRELSVFTGEITELREVALTSFGSCSFEEPHEELQKLGLT